MNRFDWFWCGNARDTRPHFHWKLNRMLISIDDNTRYTYFRYILFRWSGLKFIGISQRRRIYCRFPQRTHHWFLVIQVSAGSILPKKSNVSECVSEGSKIIVIVKFNRIKTLVTLTKDRHFKDTENPNFDEKSKKKWEKSFTQRIELLIDFITLTIYLNPFLSHRFKSIHFGIDCLHSFCSLRGTSMWI